MILKDITYVLTYYEKFPLSHRCIFDLKIQNDSCILYVNGRSLSYSHRSILNHLKALFSRKYIPPDRK